MKAKIKNQEAFIQNYKDDGYWMLNGISIPSFLIRKLLTGYSEYLLQCGYCDDDIWCEEPKAVDRYMDEVNVVKTLEEY